MENRLRLSPSLRPKLRLSQVIELSNLMVVPDEVISVVAGAISYNPDSIEERLQKIKKENPSMYSTTGKKTQTIYSSLIPSKGNSEGKKGIEGIVGQPDLRYLEDNFRKYSTNLTPDVTFIGRKNEKPELVLSDHLKGSINLMMLTVDPSEYPETAKLLSNLRKFDGWKRETLSEAYTMIGGAQREYFEDFDSGKFNIFSQDNLANKLNLTTSTISRILGNRWVEARNIEGEQKYIYSKNLLKTSDEIKKYKAIPLINRLLSEEFRMKEAYSDKEIVERLNGVLARRTISKYRANSGIPGINERNKEYRNFNLDEPYQIPLD